MKKLSGSRFVWSCYLLAGLFGLLTLVSLVTGYMGIQPLRIGEIILHGLTGVADPASDFTVIWKIRLPRVLLAGLVGASLALSGCLLQVVLENPLADPYILGVSAGAGVGAAAVMLINTLWWGWWTVPLGAFLGAILAMSIVYVLSQKQGVLSSLRLILYGVGIGSMLTALLDLLLLSNHNKTANILYWIFGSLSGQGWQGIFLLAGVFFLTWWWVVRQAVNLNALLLGEETSYHLGVDVFRLKKRLLWCSALLTSVAVAHSGLIGFVGLVVPHICRILTGAEHRRLLLLTPILGAILLLTCDTLARVLFLPGEIPVGIITALLGGPLFVYLLGRDGK
jgi:iron complex transport system permease protein